MCSGAQALSDDYQTFAARPNAKPEPLAVIMKYLIWIIYSVLSAAVLHSQCSPGNVKSRWIFSPGVSYQGQFLTEISFMYSNVVIEHGADVAKGPKVGLELNYDINHFIAGPKFSYEFTGVLFTCRGSIVSYSDGKRVDVRILPEIGLSYFGAINLTYGYGPPILKNEFIELSRHKVSLVFNINKCFKNYF